MIALLPIVGPTWLRVCAIAQSRWASFTGYGYQHNRGYGADCAVRSFLVVVSAPVLQLFASILQGQEPVSVQTLGPELAVECFDERIVCGLARP
jgi:hypothetical protein